MRKILNVINPTKDEETKATWDFIVECVSRDLSFKDVRRLIKEHEANIYITKQQYLAMKILFDWQLHLDNVRQTNS